MPVKQITLNMDLAVDSISFDAVRVALNLVANMQRLEMTARFFIQRLELSGISEQRRQPVSKIDYQALREIAKHQRLTEESASFARTNHSLTLDEACSFLKISKPTIAASMRLFLRVIAETLRCT